MKAKSTLRWLGFKNRLFHLKKANIPRSDHSKEQSDLGLFCIRMLFLSEQFGSGTQRIKSAYLLQTEKLVLTVDILNGSVLDL